MKQSQSADGQKKIISLLGSQFCFQMPIKRQLNIRKKKAKRAMEYDQLCGKAISR